MAAPKTIVFFPGSIYGPILNCIGIGDVLKQKGARVVFVVHEPFKEELEGRGYEVAPLKARPRSEEEQSDYSYKDYIRNVAPHFRETSFQQIPTLTEPSWAGMTRDPPPAQDQLERIFQQFKPDVIVQDYVVAYPAVHTSGVPFVRIVSCVPTEMRDPKVPPTFSGLPADDPSEWNTFMEGYRRFVGPTHSKFNDFVQKHGCAPLGDLEFMFQSEYLNLYLYPGILDFQRANSLPSTFHRLESCVRAEETHFQAPKKLGREGALIYVSMGSMGNLDSELRNRLISSLKKSRHRFIISLGSGAPQMELPPNFYGEGFLPQPAVLPQVDLVITHGGNNTVSESVHFGKPMVLMSLFWDQHDNAQRVHERGYGIRLLPYAFTEAEMNDAIDELLTNQQLRRELTDVSRQLQANPGTVKAAELIYQVAETKEPVLS
ncbi:MAG: glycosyltransferase [Dehalococcoidia bacterium]